MTGVIESGNMLPHSKSELRGSGPQSEGSGSVEFGTGK